MNKYAHLNEPQRELDLHQLTQAEALTALQKFLTQAQKDNLERVLIITGKGLHSEEGAVLRPAIAQFLRSNSFTFTPAKPNQGGSGAFFVRLKKN